jgi:hypothetical protein
MGRSPWPTVAATPEEESALHELVEKDLIRDGQLTELEWRELREEVLVAQPVNTSARYLPCRRLPLEFLTPSVSPVKGYRNTSQTGA